jgi:hypothetical protein
MCLAARASEVSRRFEPVVRPARMDERRLQLADGDPPPRVHVTVQRPGGPQRSAGPRRAPGARR